MIKIVIAEKRKIKNNPYCSLYNIFRGLQAFILVCALLFTSFALSGCEKKRAPITKTSLMLDTVISITLYENNASELIDDCFKQIETYESLFSKTVEGSDVYRINNSCGEWVDIDPLTMQLISTALSFEKYSDGKFSIICGALTDLWNIKERTTPPSESEIESAKSLCGGELLDVDANSCRARINTEGAKMDLGAVAKGYVADLVREYLESNGVTDGIIQLGGNVLVFGDNPNSENGSFNIGITEPFSNDSSVITGVNISFGSVVTSGNYQRYFEYEDKLYHHIIDLKTGYPADTGLNSVSIVCENSCEADCLSTICFLLGKDEAVRLLDELNQEANQSSIQSSSQSEVQNPDVTQNVKSAYQAILIDRNNYIVFDSTK